MPLGLALISVKKNLGTLKFKGFLECTYPSTYNISRGLIFKLVTLIESGDDMEQENLFELKYSNYEILAHKNEWSEESEKELILLILSPEDLNMVNSFNELFVQKIKELYKKTKSERIANFPNFSKTFFRESENKKMVFIGFPFAGKTCIKKAFFDSIDPTLLLGSSTPETTRGLVHFVYSWLDAEVGIIDSSGQDFNQYVSLDNNPDKIMAFTESDIIIYVFDIQNWQKNQQQVIENLKKVITTRNALSSQAKIYAFCHKIDLLKENNDKVKLFMNIKNLIEITFGIKTIFTSIQPNLIHTLMRSMQIILNDSSVAGNSIEDYCTHVIQDYPESAIFLLNNNNQIICQKQTSDLNLNDFSKTIWLVQTQLKMLKEIPHFNNLDYSVMYNKDGFVLIVKSINIFKFGVSNVAFIRKNINQKMILEIINKLSEKLLAF